MKLSDMQIYKMLPSLLVIILSSSTPFVISTPCSRELSRQVRQSLIQDVYPIYSQSPEKLPFDCELNPLLDKFHLQELSKFEVGINEWQVIGILYLFSYLSLSFDLCAV